MELELQPEFCGFQDKLTTFELSRGKKTNDPYYDGKNYCGKFKVTYHIFFFHFIYCSQFFFAFIK